MVQVVTELIVDARGAESGSVAYRAAMSAAQTAVDRFLDRQKAMDLAVASGSTTMVNSATSTAAAARALDKLKASIDPAFSSAKALERDIATLDRAMTHLGASEADVASMLDAVRLKHDAAAAAAKRQTDEYLLLAAAGRAAYTADQAQTSVNATLGIAPPVSGSARASAAVFDAELARMEDIARLRAQQTGQAFSSDLEASLIAGTRKSARDAASAFEQEFARLDDLARLRAQQIGSNFTEDLNARLGIGRRAASARESASVFADSEHPDAGRRLSSGQLQGLSFQGNDIVTMALLGAPISQIAASQGGQVFQLLQQGEGGITGSLKAIKGSAVDAVAAVTGFLGPVGLVAAGFGAVAVAAGAWALSLDSQAEKIEAALKKHKDLIRDIADAYPHAAAAAKAYADSVSRLPRATVQADAQQQIDANSTLYDNARIELANRITEFQRFGGRSVDTTSLNQFPEGLRSGSIEADTLRDRLSEIRIDPNAADGLKKFIEDLREGVDQAISLEAAIKGAGAVLQSVDSRNDFRGNAQDRERFQTYIADNDYALRVLRRQHEADVAGVGAKSPTEQAEAARGQVNAQPINPLESPSVRQYREEAAGALALAQAEQQLKDAQEDRIRSLNSAVSSQKLELDLIGKTAGEVARLRFEHEQIAQVREAAARAGVAADESEIASIRRKAAEMGVYADGIARANLLRDLQFEGDQLGRSPVDQQVASRLQGAGLKIELQSDLADQIRDGIIEAGNVNLQREVQFERDQLLRSPGDQNIASRQRSAGIPIDLTSETAQAIRENERIDELRSNVRGFFDDMMDGINSGDSIGESIRAGILKSLNRGFDNILDKLFDSLANTIVASLTGGNQGGGGPAGLIGDLLGSVLGGGNAASEASDNIVTGAVKSAAVDPAVLGGALQSFLSGAGAKQPWFQALAADKGGGSEAIHSMLAISPKATMDILGAGGGGGGGVVNSIGTYGEDLASNIRTLAGNIGTTARNVGALMHYESGFRQDVWGGAGGKYYGLIQAGPSERQQYGIIPGAPRSEQFQGMENFFKDRGFKPGMSGAQLYSTVNTGNPYTGNRSDAANGGRPDTAYGKWENQMGPSFAKADRLLGGMSDKVAKNTASLSEMTTASTSVTKGLGDAGSGLSDFGKGLQSLLSGGGGGGGSGGGIGGLFKSLLGGLGGGGGGGLFGGLDLMAPSADFAVAPFLPVLDSLPGFTGLFADGAAFSAGNVVPFAQGGLLPAGDVVSSPTHFPMSGGRTGLMGEAGPEAIMPLRRLPNGGFGVSMHGDDGLSIVPLTRGPDGKLGVASIADNDVAFRSDIAGRPAVFADGGVFSAGNAVPFQTPDRTPARYQAPPRMPAPAPGGTPAGGNNVRINVINHGAQVETQERQNADGSVDIEMIIANVAAKSAATRGAPLNKVLNNRGVPQRLRRSGM